MSTYLELAKQLRQELGVSGVGPSTVVDQTGTLKKVCDCLVEAEHFVSTLWSDWNFLWKQYAPTSSVDSLYNAPSDIGSYDRESFYFTIGSDEYELAYVPYKEYRKNYRDSEDGIPDLFTVRPDKKIQLEPPPEEIGSLTADYWISPVKMSADTDEPYIPARWERVFIEYAKYMFAVQFKDTELEQQSYNLYQLALRKLEAAELPEREDGLAQGLPQVIEVQ